MTLVSGFQNARAHGSQDFQAQLILQRESAYLLAVDCRTKKIVYASSSVKDKLGFDPVGCGCREAILGKNSKCETCLLRKQSGKTDGVFLGREWMLQWEPGRLGDNELVFVQAYPGETRLSNVEYSERSLSGLSHEIRNMLNGILGISELMIQDEDCSLDRLKSIHESGLSLLKVLEGILSTDGRKLRYDYFHLSKFINRLELIYSISARKKGLKFKVNHSEWLPEFIYASQERIHQCLGNLISNAVQHTESGEICLNAKMEEHSGQGYLILSVTDTGCGFSQGTVDSLFMPGNRGKHEVTDINKGLGLHFTKKLVEQMGGELTAVSNSSTGSSFTMKIPVGYSELKEMTGVSGKRTFPDTKKDSVLVVENDYLSRVYLTSLLSRSGYEVYSFSTACEAMESNSALRSSTWIVDVGLPGLRGDDFVRMAHSNGLIDSDDDVMVIGMSADRECLESSGSAFDDVLMKPFSSDELLNVLSLRQRQDKAHSKDSEQLVNLDQLRLCFKEQGGLMEEVLCLFEQDVPKKIKLLEKACDEDNLEEVRLLAHTLKSSAGLLRAQNLYQAVGALENAAKEKEYEKVSKLRFSVCREAKRAIEYIKKHGRNKKA
jgi:two-component system sensor histidine kinase TorS